MYKRISQVYFIADTKDDLTLIPDPKMNDECFVIQDACEYKAMSTGEWVKQVPTTPTSSNDSVEIDTSNFATKDELNNDYTIRRSAIDFNIPLITNARLAAAFIMAFCKLSKEDIKIKSWNEY